MKFVKKIAKSARKMRNFIIKRGVQSVARTINLAEPKTCARPVRIEKLVNAKHLNNCNEAPGVFYNSPRPVTVRVCSRKLLEMTCPKAAGCPDTSKSVVKINPLAFGMKFIMKSFIVAGLIYWTWSEGVWGDSKESEDLYMRILSTVAPTLSDIPDLQLSRIENLTHTVYGAYNHAVMTLMHLLIAIPSMIKDKMEQVVCPEKSSIEDDKKN